MILLFIPFVAHLLNLRPVSLISALKMSKRLSFCIPLPAHYFIQRLPSYRMVLYSRAVADGPVGPAMAGPIIDPVILNFLISFFFNFFPDRTNNRATYFDFRNLC